MSTTKIIKGYANPNDAPDVILWHEQQSPVGEHSPAKPATIYIGPGKLWTEEEVLKLLHAIDSAIMQDRAQMAIRHTAAKHGLTL